MLFWLFKTTIKVSAPVAATTTVKLIKTEKDKFEIVQSEVSEHEQDFSIKMSTLINMYNLM